MDRQIEMAFLYLEVCTLLGGGLPPDAVSERKPGPPCCIRAFLHLREMWSDHAVLPSYEVTVPREEPCLHIRSEHRNHKEHLAADAVPVAAPSANLNDFE